MNNSIKIKKTWEGHKQELSSSAELQEFVFRLFIQAFLT